MATEDDAALMRAAQTDPAPFGTLFDRHFTTVYRFCERRAGRSMAEDLAGETFRRAFESRSSYDLNRPSALPWLYSIALNLVRDALRARSAEDRAYARLRALAGTGWPSEDDEAPRHVEARADLAVLAGLLLAEPEEDVEALFLHVWDGLSYLDVATALGVPVGTVRSRLSRLRHRLGEGLGTEGSSSPSAQGKGQE